MRCRTFQRNLVSYLYGDLSGWRRRRADRHLQQCAECRSLFEQTGSIRNLVAGLPDETVPDELARRTLQQARRAVMTVHAPRRSLLLHPAFGFAVVLIAVGVALWTQMPSNVPQENYATDRSMETVSEKAVPQRIDDLAAEPPKAELRAVALDEAEADRPQERMKMLPTDTPVVTLCLNGGGEETARKAFLEAMEVYNRAFRETGEKRQTLLKSSLYPFQQISAIRDGGAWQLLAMALCADIHRTLGEPEKAVELCQQILKQSRDYPEVTRETRVALLKILLLDKKDYDAAEKEAQAILQSDPPRASALEACFLMGDSLAERQPKAASGWFRKAQELADRGSAEYDRAGFARAQLDARLAQGNYITSWRFIGPFDDPPEQCLVTKQPPEDEIDFTKRYPGAGGNTVKWMLPEMAADFRRPIPEGTGLRFDWHFRPCDHQSIYAVTFVRSPEKLPVNLLIGSDDSVRCWVNDELVWSNPCIRGLQPDQDTVPATLRKGWNKILLKVANNLGVWGFYFQIVDRQGEFRFDLEIDSNAKEAYETRMLR
ncbi:MAG TPA: zf-HC2 domain-containing protein [bacterium]|nr:zf-HC2 domain-containing protein [bacterium]